VEKIEVDLLANSTNRPVVKLPFRSYPGVLIQGDTLSGIYSRAVEMYDALQQCPDHKDVDAQLLLEVLAGCVLEYEAALEAHGISLPYDPRITADANRWARNAESK
jgi:hypothetical protein